MAALRFFLLASLMVSPALADAQAGPPRLEPIRSLDGNPIAEADRAFCRAVAVRDPRAFAALIAEDAVFHGSSGVTRGRAAVVKAWSGFFDPAGRTTLTWEPDYAEISASGDLGYTMGASIARGVDKDGKVVERRGRYVTIWRKTAGAWQAAVDIGSQEQPARQRP